MPFMLVVKYSGRYTTTTNKSGNKLMIPQKCYNVALLWNYRQLQIQMGNVGVKQTYKVLKGPIIKSPVTFLTLNFYIF